MLRRLVWGLLLLLVVGIETTRAGWNPYWVNTLLVVCAACLLLDEWARRDKGGG